MAVSRGNPWDYDPGPATTSGWPELFAATPNYRGLGKAVTGREAFRWHFGPMFYRGRLDGAARVLLIGQEGAQDESLSHRSFTGGTGARMQHLLTHIGVTRTYLFMNTFVYPIFGQYTGTLRGMAQNPISPIVVHRNRMFDKVAEGDLRLVIAVGEAAKESVVTWIESHGGTADPAKLHLATCGGPLAGVRFLGVLHPGGITGGGGAAIKADFVRAVGQIRTWVDADAGWLPADAGASRDLTKTFVYGSDPAALRRLPVRHLPAARSWRHVVQPGRQPAQHPVVLGQGQVHRHRRVASLRLHRRRDEGRVCRRHRRHPGRAAATLPAALRPRTACGVCAAADRRRGGARLAGLRLARRHVRPVIRHGRDLSRPVHVREPRRAWPIRTPRTICSPAGRCAASPASGCRRCSPPPG